MSKWIPCSKKMPKESGDNYFIIVRNKRSGVSQSRKGMFLGDRFIHSLREEVTHWFREPDFPGEVNVKI